MVVLITGSNSGMNDCSDHRSELSDANDSYGSCPGRTGLNPQTVSVKSSQASAHFFSTSISQSLGSLFPHHYCEHGDSLAPPRPQWRC